MYESLIPFFRPLAGGCASVLGTSTQIGSGTTTDTSVPIYGLYDNSVFAGIWLNTEFSTGKKQLTGLEFELGGYTTPYPYNNVKIYLAEVVQSTFDSDPAVDGSDMTLTNETLVFDGNISISTNGWKSIDFNVSNFCYDPDTGKHLYARVENRDGNWQSGFGHGKYAVSISRAMFKATDSAFPTGNGTRTNSRVNTKWKF
jgi:hypothetical protein